MEYVNAPWYWEDDFIDALIEAVCNDGKAIPDR